MPDIEPNGLAIGAQQEAATKPVIGGTDDTERQSKLNDEVGLSADVVKAKADLADGKISIEEFNQRAGVNR